MGVVWQPHRSGRVTLDGKHTAAADDARANSERDRNPGIGIGNEGAWDACIAIKMIANPSIQRNS